jgi:mono/diheme cytochrome c family protein
MACLIAVFTVGRRPVVFASTPDANEREANERGANERGANVFQTHGCVRCHSITGVGGDRAPDLGAVGQRLGARQIKTQILRGGHGMPPFEGILSKDEVKDLVTFLAACRTNAAPGCRQWMPAQPPQ